MNSILQCLRCSKKLRDKLCTENYMEKRLEAAPGNKGGLTRGQSFIPLDLLLKFSSYHNFNATLKFLSLALYIVMCFQVL